ncbi:MAG: LptF/LptG family permease [Candidatus Eremiobacteraeota bacterium]|nr:LptF/LptG family permease [Candidatus Eremiobacteraeota bacterium]MBV8669282.1 LptF/LptG family permease [Candidatus Eremiobacteraeota bacterium]
MKILDRYMVTALGGPFLFGLAAFTLLFVAGELLNIARLVSEEHASLIAAAKYFIYTLPGTLVLTFPMSMLLAVLLAMSRLSGDSEITAMRAGGVSLYRIAAPLVAVGAAASLVGLGFQELIVPTASAKAADILRSEIQSGGTNILSNQMVNTVLPNGDRQLTMAQGFDPHSDELQNTTIEVFRGTTPMSLLFAPRGAYHGDTWKFYDATEFVLTPCCERIDNPELAIDIGADPTQLVDLQRAPEDMSRSEIRRLLRSGVKTTDAGRYARLLVTYHSKLARPWASLVFTLLAIPLGIRPQRSSSGAGFGISIAIVFAFYVATTMCLAIGQSFPATSLAMAWLPNVVFSAAGVWMLRQAAQV